uniref:Uncharacterized protein n=1 Tax=Arundo donax TaxID=35708 RepID=A0A0A9HSW8_ARUDO
MHIANFLASPHGREDMDQQADSESSFSSGFASSFDSFDDDASFITPELMYDDEKEDESLQDTACSSAAGPKVRKMFSHYSLSNKQNYIAYALTKLWFVVAQITSMENVDMKIMPTMDANEFNMPQLVCL